MSVHTELPPPFVAVADGNTVRVRSAFDGAATTLHALGFRHEDGSSEYVYDAHDETEKVAVLTALRDANFAFERGREWSPAEVFEYMRDRGLVRGTFRSIAWRGPGAWVVRDE